MPQPKASDTSTVAERDRIPYQAGGRGRTRLLTLQHLDGRTNAVKQVREIMSDMEQDLGGPDNLSTAQRALIQRAAVLSTICEDMEVRWALGDPTFDTEQYLPVTNALRRLLESIGLQRRARTTPSLHEYLQQRATEQTEAGATGNGGRRRSR